MKVPQVLIGIYFVAEMQDGSRKDVCSAELVTGFFAAYKSLNERFGIRVSQSTLALFNRLYTPKKFPYLKDMEDALGYANWVLNGPKSKTTTWEDVEDKEPYLLNNPVKNLLIDVRRLSPKFR